MGKQKYTEHSPLPQEHSLVESEENNLLKVSEVSAINGHIKGEQF